MKTAINGKINTVFKLAAVLVVIFLAGTLGWAEDIPIDQVKITTPVYTPDISKFAPKMGKYDYRVSWNGIPAGSVVLELIRNGADYEIKASAQTVKFIDFFYKLRYSTEAVISAETLLPKHSVYHSRENSRKKETEVTFRPDGMIQSVRKDHKGRVKSIEFESDNFTVDPYSAAFLALSMDWKVGETRQFDTFNGKSRYLIELTAVEKTTITVDGRSREAIVISPSVKNLMDTGSKKKKLKQARIYISSGSDREILKISSDLFIGSVDTDMVDFTPSSANEIAAPDELLTPGSKKNDLKIPSLSRHLAPVASIFEQRYHFAPIHPPFDY